MKSPRVVLFCSRLDRVRKDDVGAVLEVIELTTAVCRYRMKWKDHGLRVSKQNSKAIGCFYQHVKGMLATEVRRSSSEQSEMRKPGKGNDYLNRPYLSSKADISVNNRCLRK